MKQSAGKGGYTLIEIIVALAVSSILFLSMLSIVAPIYKIYARTREKADAQLVAGTIIDAVRAAGVGAPTLVASADGQTLTAGEHVYACVGGYMQFDGEPIYAEGFYNGKTVTFACAQSAALGTDGVDITIGVHGGDGALCSVTTTVRSFRSFIVEPAAAGG